MNRSSVGEWANLPVELLERIFNYLLYHTKGVRDACRCSRVCRNWSRDITWYGHVDISFLGHNKCATDGLLERISKSRLGKIVGLNISAWRNLSDKGLQSIARHCKCLQHITIASGCRWAVDLENTYIIGPDSYASELKKNFLNVIGQIKTLKGVNFSNVVNTSNGNKSFMTLVQERGNDLTHLNLSGELTVRATILNALCAHCPNLELLNLTDTKIESICLEDLQRSCRKLRELHLSNLNVVLKKSRPKSRSNDLDGFPHLKVFDANSSRDRHWVTDNVLLSTLWNSPELTHLHIAACANISENVIDAIPSTKLRSVGLASRRISIPIIAKICWKWKETLMDVDLSLTECNESFDQVVLHVASTLNNVEKLNLRGTSVSEVGVRKLLDQCPKLTSIDLTSCRGVQRGVKKKHKDGKEVIELRRRICDGN